jgi:hypothetical protein
LNLSNVDSVILGRLTCLVVFFSLGFAYVLFFNTDSVILGKISLLVGFLSLGFAYYISYRQTVQIKELKNIETQTQDIALTLHSDSKTKENTRNFFPHNNKNEKYKLFFPGDYKKKTLPLINAGDSYAMYVISGLLGTDLHLRPIGRNIPENSIKNEELTCNAIFLCDQNIALKQLFGFVDLNNTNGEKKTLMNCHVGLQHIIRIQNME